MADFNPKYYYWNFIRYIKQIFLFSINIFTTNDSVSYNRILIINMILLGYITYIYYIWPFKKRIFNLIEIGSHLICFISYYMTLLSANEDGYFINYVAIIII